MLHHHHHLLHSLPLPSQLHLLTPPTPLPQGPLPLSRRSLSAAVLLPLLPTFPSAAAEPEPEPPSGSACPPAASEQTTRTAFLDISINGVPAGRITIGLFGGAGAARFASLVSGAAGISYRRKEFVKIMPGYVQHAGVRSYGADAELARRSGMEPSATGSGGLVAEWVARAGDRCSAKCVAGSVGMVVRNPAKPPPKVKVVARNGRLEVAEEEVGVDPNGTEFVIVSRDSPELDESVLVVGRVVDGMEVVERMEEVKTVQENSSSPYFRVAKLIGDKRAVVAERGFNRPYSKVVVTNCGLLD